MTDTMTPEQRHYCMSQIKGKNTKPEILVRKWLWHNGFRYRLSDRRLPGSPDIVLPKLKTVIFVNGCFWHGHEDCGIFRLPKTNVEFWSRKIKRNKLRDSENYKRLRAMGWHVLLVWECQLKKANRINTLYALTIKLGQILLSTHNPVSVNYDECHTKGQNATEPLAEYAK